MRSKVTVSDRIFIDGVEVGRTESVELVPVGQFCQGYIVQGCGRIAFDPDDPESLGANLTEFDDGTMTVSLDGGPEPVARWIDLLEDVLVYLREEHKKELSCR